MKKPILLVSLLSLALFGCADNTKPNGINLAIVNNETPIRLLGDNIIKYLNEGNIIDYTEIKEDCQGSVKLSWTYDDVSVNSIVEVSLDSSLKKPLIFKTSTNQIELTNLFVSSKYYYRVYSEDRSLYSAIGSFITEDLSPRYLNVEGICNVRDIGGIKTSTSAITQGLLYRGSEMNNHFVISESGKSTMLNDLKIKTDLDLRTSTEKENIMESPLGSSVNYIAVEEFDGYTNVISESQKENYKNVFKTLSNPDSYPVYLHCYLGADRTGTVCAILEGLMGVNDENRAIDYELTTFAGTTSTTYRSSKNKYPFIKKNIMLLYPADSFEESIELYLMDFASLTKDEVLSIKNILSGNSSANTSNIASLAKKSF